MWPSSSQIAGEVARFPDSLYSCFIKSFSGVKDKQVLRVCKTCVSCLSLPYEVLVKYFFRVIGVLVVFLHP